MNQLKKIQLEYFRGFFEDQTIEFAIPQEDKPGSGITLIVGPNNTGKTSVIEALLFNEKKRFKESERHSNSPNIIIKTDTGATRTFTNINNGSQVKKTDALDPTIGFEVIQSRRYWNYISNGSRTTNQFLNESRELDVRNAGNLDMTGLLKEINKHEEQKNKFNSLIKNIMPNFTDWTIDTHESGDYVKYITANTGHQASFLGDGYMSIFRICAHLVSDDKNRVLIIDEPELSLHPTAQKALSSMLSEAAKEKQIIICTHSPYYVNWMDFIKGAKFIRLNKINDLKCTVSILDNTKNYVKFIKKSLAEWQRPQLLDIVAKEILFSEKILFVEGQEDMGLIKKWAINNDKNLNFDIFGYGVGGYSNMKLFLEMSRDLGLHKVAALYDSGVYTDEHYEKDKKEFGNYHFEKLPTDDIRDKPKATPKPKKGCFDEHGNIKKEYETEFNEIMERIINYFKEI